jgi:hypothetical protein
MGYLKHLRPCTLDCSCKTTPCATCCPEITGVDCRTRSASKSKCGWDEFGAPSSPPKKYLVLTQSGSIGFRYEDDTYSSTTTYTGAGTYSRPDCSYNDTGAANTAAANGCSFSEAIAVYTLADSVNISQAPGGLPSCLTTSACSNSAWNIASTTVASMAGTVVCAPATGSGSITLTLSSEYTTNLLYDDTLAALSAASFGSYSGDCDGSLFTMSGDEWTITLRECEYRISFSGPLPTGATLGWDLFTDGVQTGAGGASLPPGATEYSVFAPVPTGTPSVKTLASFVLTCP